MYNGADTLNRASYYKVGFELAELVINHISFERQKTTLNKKVIALIYKSNGNLICMLMLLFCTFSLIKSLLIINICFRLFQEDR